MKDPECAGLELSALLIKPVQRVMQYPLLLEVCFRLYRSEFGAVNQRSISFSVLLSPVWT